jgi:hypothetical protein
MRNRLLAAPLLAVLGVAILALALATTATAGGRPLSTTLTGAAEIPGPGDPDGAGSARLTLNQGRRTICVSIETSGLSTPVAAHIHAGGPTVAGPIVVHLTPALATGHACVEDVDRSLVKQIRKNPDEYYVNVHTTEYPAGAIRGQLSK